MLVLPCRTTLFQGDRELYRFLLNCQEQSLRQGKPAIASWSQEIEAIDPLAVLQTVLQLEAKVWHFYWENPRAGEAIFAFEIAQSLAVESGDRFTRAKAFVERNLQHIIRRGAITIPGSGPHFFANFTFFPGRQGSFSPFPSAMLVLPAFQIARRGDRTTLVCNVCIDDRTDLEVIFARLANTLEILERARQQQRSARSRSFVPILTASQAGAERFAEGVAAALQEIDRARYSKIVLARALEAVAPAPFQLAASIDNLRRNHPDCYIFSASNGRGTNFIGASPERLMGLRDRQLIVDALAGSAPRGKTPAEDAAIARELLHSDKENREHQAVSDFIQQQMRELGLSAARSPRQVLQLSNIQHLWTTIRAPVTEGLHPLEIVAKLHPTPAMAGVPTAAACEQIRRYESCDRSLYAAPLGWLDGEGNGEFIVGIRSAFIQGDRARLYAGAGIVAGSDPDRELAEVQLKLQTMLTALVY